MSVKYTKEMEARLREVAEKEGPFNLELCNRVADEPMFAEAGKSGRSLVAKVRTMGLEYEKVEREAKTGGKPVRKDALAERMEKIVGEDLPDLSKAGKIALQRLVDWAESVQVDA